MPVGMVHSRRLVTVPDYFDRLIPSLERTVEGLRRGSEPERLQYYETALRELREMRELYDNGC